MAGLGFSYQNGIIDLSETTKKKIKRKINRNARKLRRWMIKKNASIDIAIKAMNTKFNKKFYGYNQDNYHELTWSKWFFPLINTSNGLDVTIFL